jgi:hypothetical protein
MADTRETGFVADSGDLQRVEHAVALILAEKDRPVEVYAAVLEAIGGSLGWELGAVWEAGRDDERLRCVCTWHAGEGAPEFEALSERIVLARGEGLPGHVLDRGEPAWLVDAPRTRTSRARRPRGGKGCTRPSASRSSARKGCSASWSCSRTTCASRRSRCSRRCG